MNKVEFAEIIDLLNSLIVLMKGAGVFETGGRSRGTVVDS